VLRELNYTEKVLADCRHGSLCLLPVKKRLNYGKLCPEQGNEFNFSVAVKCLNVADVCCYIVSLK
jgi:hypothetical protein